MVRTPTTSSNHRKIVSSKRSSRDLIDKPLVCLIDELQKRHFQKKGQSNQNKEDKRN